MVTKVKKDSNEKDVVSKTGENQNAFFKSQEKVDVSNVDTDKVKNPALLDAINSVLRTDTLGRNQDHSSHNSHSSSNYEEEDEVDVDISNQTPRPV